MELLCSVLGNQAMLPFRHADEFTHQEAQPSTGVQSVGYGFLTWV